MKWKGTEQRRGGPQQLLAMATPVAARRPRSMDAASNAHAQSRVPSLEQIVRRYIGKCITLTQHAVIALRSNAHNTLAMDEHTEADVWDELAQIESICREMEEYLHEVRLAIRESVPIPSRLQP